MRDNQGLKAFLWPLKQTQAMNKMLAHRRRGEDIEACGAGGMLIQLFTLLTWNKLTC